MSDSPELKAIKKYTPELEIALSGLERDLVHFLAQKGFISDEVSERVLDSRSFATEEEKAGLLVKGIKRRVKLDANSFHTLLNRFRESGNLYRPILTKLEKECSDIIGGQTDRNVACDGQTQKQGKYH